MSSYLYLLSSSREYKLSRKFLPTRHSLAPYSILLVLAVADTVAPRQDAK